MQRALADIGWTLTYFGDMTSKFDSWAINIESEDRLFDHPTLIATLRRLGVPLEHRDTTIDGDVLLTRQSVDARERREVDIEDIRLSFLGIKPQVHGPWGNPSNPGVDVCLTVSPIGTVSLRTPIGMHIVAMRGDGKSLGGSSLGVKSGENTIFIPVLTKEPNVHLLVRILDVHRAGEVLIGPIPVAWDQAP